MPESICNPQNHGKKFFSSDGISLVVPGYLEDRAARWLIDRGRDLETAYKEAGIGDLLPERGLDSLFFQRLP